jgi:transcriptional regulator of heat shock response
MYELREYVKQVLDNPPPGRETEEFEEKLHRLTASFDSDMKLAVGVLSVLYCCQEVSEVMESDSGTCSQMLFVAESLESKLMVRVPFRNVLQRLLRFF